MGSTRHTMDNEHHEPWETKLSPLLELFDVLGRRWSLRIVWELNQQGAATFRELQARAEGISSSVLSDRLRDLRAAGVVGHERGVGYSLTPIGCGLGEKIIDIWFWLQSQPEWSTARQ